MDRSLDDSIAERQRSSYRGRRAGPPPPRRNDYPRDGVRKSTRDDRTNLDNDWVHDRFEDEPARTRDRSRRDVYDREVEDYERPAPPPAKLRVENLHYDLTEEDIYDLFERIAPVIEAKLRYDRAGRSEGTAYVTYAHVNDARAAIREFDGANAKGQPIRLSLIPLAPAAQSSRRDNPFDRAQPPSRSLFERIEPPRSRRRSESPISDDTRRRRGGGNSTGRDRASEALRRSDVSKPAPENIDRYVPGESDGRSSSRRDARENGRRPGERRERGGGRGGRDRTERDGDVRMVNGRPRKTQEELDAEMEDYWASSVQNDQPAGTGAASNVRAAAAPAPAVHADDDDIDMIE